MTVEKEVKDIKEEMDKLLGKITKLTEQNEKQDENISTLLSKVSELEEDAETRESLEDAVGKKLDAWVVTNLDGILDKKINGILAGANLRGKVDTIVKSLLGHKGEDGTIVSTGQLCERGRLKNLKELKDDINKHYRMVINKYVLRTTLFHFVRIAFLKHVFCFYIYFARRKATPKKNCGIGVYDLFTRKMTYLTMQFEQP
jgi:hypothetical protein